MPPHLLVFDYPKAEELNEGGAENVIILDHYLVLSRNYDESIPIQKQVVGNVGGVQPVTEESAKNPF